MRNKRKLITKSELHHQPRLLLPYPTSWETSFASRIEFTMKISLASLSALLTATSSVHGADFINEVVMPQGHTKTSNVVSPLPHTWVFVNVCFEVVAGIVWSPKAVTSKFYSSSKECLLQFKPSPVNSLNKFLFVPTATSSKKTFPTPGTGITSTANPTSPRCSTNTSLTTVDPAGPTVPFRPFLTVSKSPATEKVTISTCRFNGFWIVGRIRREVAMGGTIPGFMSWFSSLDTFLMIREFSWCLRSLPL